ncbi:MAG: GNAT family N-acetyltransferase [Bacteroidota bacterium]|nr:GNAT family N-acetyltransferase [Bacteroidota bacterium]
MIYTIRNYEAEDEQAVVALWNQCLPRDEISLNTFRRKIILDPNFDGRGCFVATAKMEHGVKSKVPPTATGAKQVVGFLLSIRRRYPYFDLGLETGKGWVTAFFVHPQWRRQKIAAKLFFEAERFMQQQGVRDVFISDYTPNYFIPGIDRDAYAESLLFLKELGYKKVEYVYGMGHSLIDMEVPQEVNDVTKKLNESGFSVGVFQPRYTLKVLEFLRQNYPGDLFRVALERITEDPECDEILVALKGDDVVGFSHFLDERYGPFGIHKDYMGRGLGPMLYYSTIQQMRKKGKRNLWLAWTTGRAKDFYHKVGLKVIRRHMIMKKDLGE